MNRHKFRVIAALLSAVMLMLCACQSAPPEEENKPPTPISNTIESSDNSYGACYKFTLGSITKEMVGDFESLNLHLDISNWETLSTGLVDDNGVRYSSYCNHVGAVTVTAAVEIESGKLMNIGCGCQTKQLSDKAFKRNFLRLAALIAVHAGGYSKDDLDYFIGIYKTLVDGDDDTLRYESSLYIESVDDSTTVLMTMPCSETVLRKNQYIKYDLYYD